MVSTGLIRDYIMNEEKTSQIREAIAAGTSQYGMQTFDQSLFHNFQSGLITFEEALRGASNPDEFRLRVSGIHSAADQAKEEMERIGNVSSPAPRTPARTASRSSSRPNGKEVKA
jgi:twitching motility protein PilT